MAKEPEKVHLVSLGCPKNTVDSERMLGLLNGHDYEITSDAEEADVVIVNTCGFIGPAKEESIEAIMEAHELKKNGRCKGVIVIGCLAERYQDTLKEDLIEADQILTLRQEDDIVRNVDELLGHERTTYLDNVPRLMTTPSHWAYLRISDGCDHKCAFCAIPLIKGRHHSETIEDLVTETKRLAAGGVRELVLVAQDSVRYGADLYGRPQLVPLLEQLAAVEGISWMRLMYTYPAFWTEEMIDFYAECEKMCNYIDMPLQHISDPVLKRMRRATTKAKTERLLERLRERLTNVGLRSSFIVGFPGETEAQFDELLGFVEQTRFDNATCFIYSHEEGTEAHGYEGELPEYVKEERYRQLTELQDGISADINHGLIGTQQVVLVDTLVDGEAGSGWSGRMQRDAPEIDGHVRIDAGPDKPGVDPGVDLSVGKFAQVEITGAYSYELAARWTGRSW